MAFEKIKTEWASVKLTHYGPVVVCANLKDTFVCICFENLQAFKNAIDKKKISVRKWAASVPSSCCIFKTVELPAESVSEAFKMVEFELASLVPIPSEKLVYGCTLLSSHDNLLDVLVCIMKIDTLEHTLEPYRAIGIYPNKVIADSAALSCWFNTINKQNSDTAVNVLFDKGRCQIIISSKGNLHSFEKIKTVTDNTKLIMHQLTSEIIHKKNELAHLGDGETAINLAAPKVNIAEIKDFLEENEHTDLGTVSVLECPRIVFYEDKAGYQTNELYHDATVAEGLARSTTQAGFEYLNLLPKRLLKKVQQKAQLINYAVTAGLSFLLIFALWLNFVLLNWRIERTCRKIHAQIAPVEHIATSVEGKRQRVKAIQKQLSNRGQISLVLQELYKYSPRSISISEIKFTSHSNKVNITIKGQADSLSNAFEYSKAMKDARLLNDIHIINAQQVPRPGGSVVEFKADCMIRSI